MFAAKLLTCYKISLFQNSKRFEERRRSASQPPDSDGLHVLAAGDAPPPRSERAESTSSNGEHSFESRVIFSNILAANSNMTFFRGRERGPRSLQPLEHPRRLGGGGRRRRPEEGEGVARRGGQIPTSKEGLSGKLFLPY